MPQGIDRECLSNFLKNLSKSQPVYFDYDKVDGVRTKLVHAICDYLEDLYDFEPHVPKPQTVPFGAEVSDL
jgi:hypothetical protein